MNDVLGREIKEGDVVVKSKNGNYAEIFFARVVGFTKQQVRLKPANLEFYKDKSLLSPMETYHELGTYLSYPSSILIVNKEVE